MPITVTGLPPYGIQSAGNDITVPTPAVDHAPGRRLVMFARNSQSSNAIREPAGWDRVLLASENTNLRGTGVWTRTVPEGGLPAGSVSIGRNGGGRWAVALVMVDGALNIAASGTTTSTTTPAITTPDGGTYLAALGTESTSPNVPFPAAAEGATRVTQASSQAATNASRTTLEVLAAPARPTTITPAQIQANGPTAIAALTFTPAPVEPEPEPTRRFYDDAGRPGRLYVQEPDVTTREIVRVHVQEPATSDVDRVATFWAAQPYYISHRCGGRRWPEFSEAGVRGSLALGYKALEISVYESSDGVWVCSHDYSTQRMTGVNHGIGTTPWATLAALTSTAEFTDQPDQPRTPLITLAQVLAWAPDAVLYVDHKESSYSATPNAAQVASRTRLLDYLDAQPSATGRFVWKVFGDAVSSAQAGLDRGYRTWSIHYAPNSLGGLHSDLTHASMNTTLGMEFQVTQALWDPVLAVGKPVVAHIVTTTAQAQQGIARGARGLMNSSPHLAGP